MAEPLAPRAFARRAVREFQFGLAGAAVSPSTRRAYAAHVLAYAAHCSARRIFCTPYRCQFIEYILSRTPSTGKSHGAALWLVSDSLGYARDPTTWQQYRHALKALKRRRSPMLATPTIPASAILRVAQDTRLEPLLRATLLIATLCCLRPCSVAGLRRRHLRLHPRPPSNPDGGGLLTIRIKREKNLKWKGVHRAVAIELPALSFSIIDEGLRALAADAHLPRLAAVLAAVRANCGPAWKPKFLRRSGCTLASHAGFTMPQLKQLGDWRDAKTVSLHYLDSLLPPDPVACLLIRAPHGSPVSAASSPSARVP